MTRKEQLKAIPYPVAIGESEKDKRDYALALAVAEHWETLPKTITEQELMAPSLPDNLKRAVQGGALRHSMLKYLLDKLGEMEQQEKG